MTDNTTYLTQKQVADLLHISTRTLERLRTEGGGPRYFKAGRRVLYSESAINDWLQNRSFENASEARAEGIK